LSLVLYDGWITTKVEKAQSSVESSYIENTELERKDEKKLKVRIVKEKTTKEPLCQASW
jgi:hypothetical protein